MPVSKSYWLIPPNIYNTLDQEFHFDYDPCPFPRPEGFNSLSGPWGNINWVNPPFCRADGPNGGQTAFARKAIFEQTKGHTSVIVLPVTSPVALLIQAGADIRPAGRIPFLHTQDRKPWPSPVPCAYFILRPK